MDSPWAKAALNAATGLLTEPMLMFLAAAGPDTPDLATLRRQARSWPYRPGYEQYKGELAEAVLMTYGGLLGPWAAGTLRATATLTAREAAAGLAELRAELRAPRLNPLNYRFELQGLGSTLGNVKVRYAGAAVEEGVAAAEHLQPPELAMPPLSEATRAHIYLGDVRKESSRGWHYEPTGDAAQGTYVLESTRSPPDAHGVYEANVVIQGVKKNARSSFFPANWTQEQVETAIKEAYATRKLTPRPGRYRGRCAGGFEIEMDVDPRGHIQTAYPIYERGR